MRNVNWTEAFMMNLLNHCIFLFLGLNALPISSETIMNRYT